MKKFIGVLVILLALRLISCKNDIEYRDVYKEHTAAELGLKVAEKYQNTYESGDDTIKIEESRVAAKIGGEEKTYDNVFSNDESIYIYESSSERAVSNTPLITFDGDNISKFKNESVTFTKKVESQETSDSEDPEEQ